MSLSLVFVVYQHTVFLLMTDCTNLLMFFPNANYSLCGLKQQIFFCLMLAAKVLSCTQEGGLLGLIDTAN